jgi:hypothetical protein
MTEATQMTGHCDFDLHGVVGLRVLDATDRDLESVRRQLGLPPVTLTREPDVTVRFVDRVSTGPLTYVGLDETGFNEDGFVVLKGNGGRPDRAMVPFDAIGDRPEVRCERGASAVPHLLAILNLTALAKGILPLHATAFTLHGQGVLVTGWSKGGKTETLLAAAAHGAHYVGDEWVFLTSDGTMWGLPERIRLWSWQLDQFPEILSARSRGDRRRLRVWRAMATSARAAARLSSRAPFEGAAELARKTVPVLERQSYVRVPPADLVGRGRVALTGRLDAVVLVMSSSAEAITTRQAAPLEVSGRMAASLAEERAPFMAHYRQFRFAFPGRSSDLVERSEALEARLLADLFDRRPAAVVTHPHPCDIEALGDAVLTAAKELSASAAPPVAASAGGGGS